MSVIVSSWTFLPLEVNGQKRKKSAEMNWGLKHHEDTSLRSLSLFLHNTDIFKGRYIRSSNCIFIQVGNKHFASILFLCSLHKLNQINDSWFTFISYEHCIAWIWNSSFNTLIIKYQEKNWCLEGIISFSELEVFLRNAEAGRYPHLWSRTQRLCY